MADHYAELLRELGFSPVAEVHKTRRPGKLVWQGWDVETALDEVVNLGTFAELEVMASDHNLAEAKDCIQSLARQLQLDNVQRSSYLEMLLAK